MDGESSGYTADTLGWNGTDRRGETLRLGLLVPSSNTVLEPEAQRVAAQMQGLSLHFSRVRVTRISTSRAEDLQFGAEPMAAAAALLGDAGVDAVAWAGTAGSWLGLAHEGELVSALERAAKAPATTSTLGLLAACRALGARTVGLVTPYTADVVERIADTYAREGLTVVAESHLDMSDNRAFGDVSPGRIATLVRNVAASGPEVVMVVCTNLRATGAVADLERELEIPVLDSIGATVWHATIAAGQPVVLGGHGVLLGQGSVRADLARLSERLLEATDADRVTVRLDVPDLGFDVDAVAAEAVTERVRPIAGDRSISQWELPTIRRLRATLAPLVQEHPNVDPGIPPVLCEHYGVQAQVLGPLEDDGQLRGWLSIHSSRERTWGPAELEALATAAARVAGRFGWRTRVVAP